jgi:hypothetical protein
VNRVIAKNSQAVTVDTPEDILEAENFVFVSKDDDSDEEDENSGRKKVFKYKSAAQKRESADKSKDNLLQVLRHCQQACGQDSGEDEAFDDGYQSRLNEEEMLLKNLTGPSSFAAGRDEPEVNSRSVKVVERQVTVANEGRTRFMGATTPGLLCSNCQK